MVGTIKLNYTFNDGTGTTLSDVSLYNRDATLTTDGSGVWTTDIPFDASSNAAVVHPNSYYFKGGDYFSADVSDNWSGSFTFSIWAKPTQEMNLYESIFSSSDSHNVNNSWQLEAVNNGNWNIRVNTTNNGVKSFNIEDISENNWQHIAISWQYSDISSNKLLKTYFNGNLVQTYNIANTNFIDDLNFTFVKYKLASNRSEQSLFKGYLTNVIIYDSVLSDDEIAQLYNYDTDPSGSIHKDCSDCATPTPTSQHVFLSVYLSNDKIVLDSSENAVTTLDASYNFIMDANSASAFFFRNFLKYKKNNNQYTFSFNESYKILFEQALKTDIEDNYVTIYDSSFNSGINPKEASIGRMLVRYIADTLMGHPFAQAFIANESEIIDSVNNSNLYLQLTNALVDGLSTSSFTTQELCNSLIIQFVEESPDRFFNEVENTEYKFPFCPGDYISLFVKMNCTIDLHEINASYSNQNVYQTLKKMFQSNNETIFDDSAETMKMVEKIWRIKIKLK
jgi:hypothetical protein